VIAELGTGEMCRLDVNSVPREDGLDERPYRNGSDGRRSREMDRLQSYRGSACVSCVRSDATHIPVQRSSDGMELSAHEQKCSSSRLAVVDHSMGLITLTSSVPDDVHPQLERKAS
jgi:hypothetical protein